MIADDFEFLCQSSEKVVPEWDTDLNLRLKQLDNVLAMATKSPPQKSDNLGNKVGSYPCLQCPATFNSCTARNSHRQSVHQRFHLCHECDMAFASAQKLERHMKTHSGIKEFRCETCGKEFMIERNLVSLNTFWRLTLSGNLHLIFSDSPPQITLGAKRLQMFRVPSNLLHQIRTPSSRSTTACSSLTQKPVSRFRIQLQRLPWKISDQIWFNDAS